MAGDVIRARRLVLKTREMQRAMSELAEIRPAGPVATWAPDRGLDYWLRLGQLAATIDRLFSEPELDALSARWENEVRAIRGATNSVGVGFVAGRSGRGRPTTDGPLEISVRSLSYRLAGVTASRADELTADELNDERPARYWISSTSVAVYRKRLRDRLA